jgi:hypothetical protein
MKQQSHKRVSSRFSGGRILESPEFNVLLFAFLLNYPWEFVQVPFFQGMPEAGHWEGILFCSRAAGGDALIALVAFWVVALRWRDRGWILQPSFLQVLVFVGGGVFITILFEWHATQPAGRWAYAESMPVLPILGTGLLPLIQWILLPPIIVWLVYRQIGRRCTQVV